MANYLSANYDEILKKSTDALADTKKKGEDAINASHDSQVTLLNDQYEKAVGDANIAYESEYQKNAVQKLINEKKIAETNANLGLTDSGLNRTQQTATQLSYANQKGKIDLAKQSALDTLSQNLASSLASIEQSRVTSLADLDTSIASQAQSNAISQYNTNIEANTKMYEAEQDAAAKVQTAAIEAAMNNSAIYKINYGELANTTYASNGNVVYTDINGNSVTMRAGTNPFTNTINKDVFDEWGEYDKSKVFSNGYQPNNINGKQLKQYGSATINFNGNIQKVWTTNGEDCYYWDGSTNKYIKLSEEEKISIGG